MKWVKTQTHFKRPIYVSMEDQIVSWCILHYGMWEEHIDRYVTKHLKADDVFLDIGANLGYFSLLAAHNLEAKGGSGFVVAVEANPVVIPYLMGSIVESGLAHRVRLLPYAAADRAGLVQMHEHTAGNLGSVTLRSFGDAPESGKMIVPSVRLDDVLIGLDRLDFVKMDIEGAEVLALDGMSRLLEKFSPDIVAEINTEHLKSISGVSAADFVEKMRRFGYTPHTFSDVVQPVSLDDLLRILDAHQGHCDFVFKRKVAT